MKPVNIRDAKTHACRPVKIGGLKSAAPVPENFNTMFESHIEALFAGAASAKGHKRT